MNWIEAAIDTNDAGAEVVCGVLVSMGIEAMQIEDSFADKRFLETNRQQWDYIGDELINAESGGAIVKIWMPDNEYGRARLSQIAAQLDDLRVCDLGFYAGTLAISSRVVSDDGWADGWKRYYKPFRFTDKIVIKPEWEEYEKAGDEVVLTLNPGGVFGTGLHQSTRLCAALLGDVIKGGEAVLDLGCGSGVLALSALALGAKFALGIDRDAAFYDTARHNAELNCVCGDRLALFCGDLFAKETLDKIPKIRYDVYGVCVANIVASAIIELAPIVRALCKRHAPLIAGGIIRERRDEVLSALKNNGMKVLRVTEMDEWVAVLAEIGQ